MKRWMVLGGIRAVMVTLVVALAGCGGSVHATVSAPPATTVIKTTRTPAPPPATNTVTAPSPTPASSTGGPPRCSELAATDDGGQGAGGTYYGRVTFRNVTDQTCVLGGFAGLQHLDPAGRPLPTNVIRDGSSHLVTLAPQARASFAYRTSDGATGPCQDAPRMEVTPPGSYHQIVVVEKAPDCEPGIGVSAVMPGRIQDLAAALR
ncbi:MAG: DUF4232 domain-containing protein [Actinomycetota bacterium]|nr:DUF4232 domain-containing protein [Actinomycetota bacterium]